ncbi:MAG: hypothetical protein ACWA5Q_06680 [bacterium]
MDQDEFRQTYREYNESNCVFEKSVLTNECQCSQVNKFCIAEREGAHCRDSEARELCVEFLELMREQTRFALRTNSDKGILPHGKAIRIQVGGLRGVLAALNDQQTPPKIVPNVHGALVQAVEQFGSLEKLPYPSLMQHVSAYQGKVRSRRNKKKD